MEEEIKRLAAAVDVVLNHFGARNGIATLQDPTVSSMMTDDDLIYSRDYLKIFSVAERMYVVDSHDVRVLIWDTEQKHSSLYRPNEVWTRELMELEKKALDADYAKNPPEGISLAEGFVETE